MSEPSNDPAPPPRPHPPVLHRMPQVPARSLVELALVVAAYAFALAAPSFVVSPAAVSAPPGRIVAAVALTAVGAAAALAVTLMAYNRTRNYSWLIIGGVPSFTFMMGAAILAGTKAG